MGMAWLGGKSSHHRRVNPGYVSEFTGFINHFLEEHPEVVADQKAGRSLYWDRKVDPLAEEAASKDVVPDTQYGFHYPVQHAKVADPSKGV